MRHDFGHSSGSLISVYECSSGRSKLVIFVTFEVFLTAQNISCRQCFVDFLKMMIEFNRKKETNFGPSILLGWDFFHATSQKARSTRQFASGDQSI